LNVNGESNEVMTLAEVAAYLHLAERTVLRMARRGEIPAAKVASQWRFMRSLVQDWLASWMQMGRFGPDAAEKGCGRSYLRLSEVLRPELMSLDIEPGPKEAVLRQLSRPLEQTGFVKVARPFLSSLIDRERMMTTAIGRGVAIPHPRRPAPGMFPEPAIALGICREGADFQAIDDQPVHVFFLICATREDEHLQMMAKATWVAGHEQTVSALRSAVSPDAASTLLQECLAERQAAPGAADPWTGRPRQKP